LEKEEIEQVEKEFEKLYPLSTNRRNIRSRYSKQSQSTVPMACENVEVDTDDDDNFFDIDKFVHSLGFKASNQSKESAFSVSGYVQRQNRMRFSIRSLRYSMVLKEKEKLRATNLKS
jgi:hypothetical protein